MKIGLFLYLFCFLGAGQPKTELPLTLLKSKDQSKPLIVYISGDGGMNSFSTSLMKSFNSNGYSVIGVNAHDYFWKKKSPEIAAADISGVVSQYLRLWNLKGFLLVGYSFGADVAPFIFSRWPQDIAGKARQLVLLSPSSDATFEIKLVDMLGLGKSRGVRVAAEINKLLKPVLLVFGNDEKDFPLNQIKIRNKEVLTLAGGHHYEGGDNLAQQLIYRFQ